MSVAEISVIVPVHNVEMYLADCLRSIQNQSHGYFECICVDDGSSDNSPEILKSFASRDERFKVVTTDNRGVSSARNLGLAMAAGEYIAFVDSDDFIHHRYLERLLQALHQSGADVACCRHRVISASARYQPEAMEDVTQDTGTTISLAPLHELLHCSDQVMVEVWNKLYRRGAIGTLQFDSSLSAGEDSIFTFQFLNQITKLISVRARLVYYRDTPNSLSKHTKHEWRLLFLDKWSSMAAGLHTLQEQDRKRFKRKSMRYLFRDMVKRPIVETKGNVRMVMEKSREHISPLVTSGHLDFAYLTVINRLFLKLLLARKYAVLSLLMRSDFFNWKRATRNKKLKAFSLERERLC